MKKVIIIIAAFLMVPRLQVSASVPNEVLAAWIVKMSHESRDALKSHKEVQILVAEGHVFIGREVQATNEFLREFNNYLDTFHDAISLAAELYGTFLEIQRTKKLVGEVTSTLSSAPANSLAVMLSPNKNGIYGDIINTSLEVGQDIYNACLSKQKRTEQDRNVILSRVRLKIKKVNSMLAKLVTFLIYTSLEDIWHNVTERYQFMDKEGKHAVIERTFDRWHHNTTRRF